MSRNHQRGQQLAGHPLNWEPNLRRRKEKGNGREATSDAGMKANVGVGGPPGRRREAGGSAGHLEPLALAGQVPPGMPVECGTRRPGRRDLEEKSPRRCPRGFAMSQRQDFGGEDTGGSVTHWSFFGPSASSASITMSDTTCFAVRSFVWVWLFSQSQFEDLHSGQMMMDPLN